MIRFSRMAASVLLVGTFGLAAVAQVPPPVGTATVKDSPKVSVPRPTGNAATVNGQALTEVSVARALRAIPETERAKARPEIVNFLVENLLIDQYLTALKLVADPKEVETQFADFKKEVIKANQEYTKVLDGMWMTEDELKDQIGNQIRWEKFVAQQGSEEQLQKVFASAMEVFDGSRVRARHVLVMVPAGSAPAKSAEATAKLAALKVQIEKTAAEGIAKIDPSLDNLAKEQKRSRLIDDAFQAAAKDNSDCPSKRDGGDLNWFPRSGSMVEPFAKAAFALKPYTISEPVVTEFGVHLIMVTNRKPGEPTKFADPGVKEAVREYFSGRLREAIVAQRKPVSKIELTAK